MAVNVFIAEDNKAARESLSELLIASAGVNILGHAESEFQATEWLSTHQGEWNVFICDLLLIPGGSGFALIQRARQQRDAGKVAVFSAFITEAVAKRCRDLGADAVFDKSQLQGLIAFVRSLNDGASA